MILRPEDMPPFGFPVGLWMLRGSDNTRHIRLFKQLVRDGLELHGALKNDDRIPSLSIVGKTPCFVWLFPKFEQFVLRYLLTGCNSGIPKYPRNNDVPDFRAGDDYIDRHIKREIERGKYTCEEEVREGVNGIRFVGRYLYGTIDYGFHPCSREEFNARLAEVEPFRYDYDEEEAIPELHYSNLPMESKALAEGEHLDSVFPDRLIPTNTIIDKTICGCGATWLEIHSPRHSIVIEPNVPVIMGKEQQHPHLIGVYGATLTASDIADKVARQEGWVKIMTTPDSYPKVIKALKQLRIAYLDEFFLLFDECEKIVSDIDFRPNLDLPIDDFFRFRHKAMVSATPIAINDPRFEAQGFRVIKIAPLFDHKRQLEFKPTNNVKVLLEKTIDDLPPESVICVFFNSVSGIKEWVDTMKIGDESNIYCSTTARKGLLDEGYRVFDSVTDEQGQTTLSRYNFFTSRFYSAVDIRVECKPVVILVTQVHKTAMGKTSYSLIDPETEAVQIAGRFRNGIERLIHITDTDSEIEYKTRDELEQFLKEEHDGYHKLLKLSREVETDGERHILRQAIDRTDYHAQGYVDGKNRINYFRYNNAYLDERLKMLYRYSAALYQAYKRSRAFTVVSDSEYTLYTDSERRVLLNRNNPKAQRITLLNEILVRMGGSGNFYDARFIEELRQDYALYIEALPWLKLRKIKQLDFKNSAVEAELKRVKFEKKALADEVKQAVYEAFPENTWYETSYVNENLHRIFNDRGIECGTIGLAKHLELYFRCEDKRRNRERGWMIYERRAF